MNTNKALEKKLRRTLKSAGYVLHKSRVRNIHFNNLGGYYIVDLESNFLVWGDRAQLSLEDVAEWAKGLIA